MRNLLLMSGAAVGIIVECSVLVVLLIALLVVSVKLLRSDAADARAPQAAPQEEQKPEPVAEAEPAPAAEPEPEPEPVAEEEPEPAVVPLPVAVPELTPEQEEQYRRLTLDRSFTARLVQADDNTKEWYAALKNALLSYKGVHSRIS